MEGIQIDRRAVFAVAALLLLLSVLLPGICGVDLQAPRREVSAFDLAPRLPPAGVSLVNAGACGVRQAALHRAILYLGPLLAALAPGAACRMRSYGERPVRPQEYSPMSVNLGGNAPPFAVARP